MAPPIVQILEIWPIQAPFPKPSQWEGWHKQSSATLLGVPLWSVEELTTGYVFALFSLPATDPSHAVQWRFVTDRPPPLQHPSSEQVRQVSKQTAEPAP